jgi:hypothetical protein
LKHLVISLIFLGLVSCSDEYRLVVEPETNDIVTKQTYHLNINGKITYPDTKTNTEFDIEKDRFEVIKIRFVPIKKYNVVTNDDNEWGQAGLTVKIIKKGFLLANDEVIFKRYISEFYNPGIENITEDRKAAIRTINGLSLDSGLGDRGNNNRIQWADYSNLLFTKLYLDNNEENFYNTLIRKTGPKIGSGANLDVLAIEPETRLAWDDLSKCTVFYPFNDARFQELKEF